MLPQRRSPKTRRETESVLRYVLEGAKVIIDRPELSETESGRNPRRFEGNDAEHQESLVLPKQRTEPPATMREPRELLVGSES